ncbi:FAD-binding oxidoreductase [Streptomyces roseoverticillatus]|uniref:FAD-binding oxidoreductase n=1 Tax=Streptomyces roseoverticillatus TaxID=66429 RepID=UPI001F19B9F8|nr:FAD-binding oxidoreductase [Streptomyces roseoverticillatus]MCF3105593.1 FAD-binding oxidoreductase [Streptomyces roseoverticillatus]
MDRRTVLRAGAGAGLAAGLWAPAGRATAATRKDRDWAGLKQLLGGRLYVPGDSPFAALNLPANHLYSHRLPAAIACPRTHEEVLATVEWAGRNVISVVPRSGGHSYAGYSTSDGGLLVHLGGMRDVTVKGTTLTVGAGARHLDVYAALKDTGLLLPGGRCPDVGVSGLVLGGGIGPATRSHGLTCDSLTGTTVVTGDAYTARCDENSNSELFWACRGGAGGNFGINTSFTFDLHPVRKAVAWFDLSWDGKDAAPALKRLAELIADPRHRKDLTCQFGLRTSGETRVYAQGLFFGSERTLRQLVTPLRPRRSATGTAGIWECMRRFYETAPGDPYVAGSIVAGQDLGASVVEELVDALGRWKQASPASRATVSFFAMGGADTALRAADTAYVHRDATFIVDLAAYWSDTDPTPVSEAGRQQLRALYRGLSRTLGTDAYQNFPDPDLRNWQTAYYGRNYARLQTVKKTVDPGRLFGYPQGIAPA